MAVTAESWFPVLTLLLGYGAAFVSEFAKDRRARQREQDARQALRRDKLTERQIDFQRQTLLDLQDAVMQLARAAGTTHHHDMMAYRETGQWQKQLLSDELSESERLAQARTTILAARVRDPLVRDMVKQFKHQAARVGMTGAPDESESTLLDMTRIFERLNERVGELLRQLDEEPV